MSVPLAALVALLDRLLVAEGGFQIRGAHARIEVAYADFKSEVHTRKVAARWRVAEFKSEVHAQARALTYWRWRMAEFKSEVHLRELFAWGLKSSISHCEKQPPSNLIRPEPCERHRREMVRRGYGP